MLQPGWSTVGLVASNETVMLEKTPWTARRSNQSILKDINPEYSLEGLMLKLQLFGHLMWRANSLEDPDAGKSWRQEEKGMTEDEMVGWHHRLNEHNIFSPGDGEGQESLACCSPWGHKESDTTEWLNNNKSESSNTAVLPGTNQYTYWWISTPTRLLLSKVNLVLL